MRYVRTQVGWPLAALLFGAAFASWAPAAAPKSSPPKPEGPPDEHVSLGRAVVTTMQVGVRIKAAGGPIRNFHVQVAAPLECPEQEVRIVGDDFSAELSGDERLLNEGNARQLVIALPFLDGGRAAHGIVTYEIKTYELSPPTSTDALHAPQRVERELAPYLKTSPYIEVGHTKIKNAIVEALKPADDAAGAADSKSTAPTGTLAASAANQPALDSPFGRDAVAEREGAEVTEIAEATSPALNDWKRVEAFYDFALKKIKYVESNDKSAVKALDEGKGDCQAVSALFVAMCRTAKVPARMVWSDGHQYAEFYLEDSADAGHWYPIESAGTRVFGGTPLPRVIYQKGDNFRVPERRGEALRYASDFVKGDQLAGPPKVTFVHARE